MFFNISPIPEINFSEIRDQLPSKLFIAEFKNIDKDVHYTIIRDKLYSLGESIKMNGEKEFSHAERFGKIIYEVYFEDKSNEYNLMIYCDKIDITPYYFRKGPSIKDKNHAAKFKTKNKDYFIKNDYLWTKTQRDFSDFFQFLQNFITNRIPQNLELINLSKSFGCKSSSGKKGIYVLKNMVLPFCS
jgi:tRNA nucleotidyltransferase (CCA-adding enzyme)